MKLPHRSVSAAAAAFVAITALAGAALCEAQAPPQPPSGSRVPPPPPASFEPGQPPMGRPGQHRGGPVTGAPRIPTGQTVSLPTPRTNGTVSVEAALSGRHTMRAAKGGRLTLAEASQLLWAAQGVTGEYARRAAPSAGGVYPIEVVLVVSDVEGLRPGVYRYWGALSQVERLGEGDRRSALAQVAPYNGLDQVPAVVVITAVEARSAGVLPSTTLVHTQVAVEAGAVMQNLMLQAVALGLGTAEVAASDPVLLAQLLGLPPGEVPFAVVVVAHE